VACAAALSSRSWPRFELQSLLSALQLRSPVDRVGPELFQVLLFCAAGIPFNEQALEDDFSRLTKFLLTPAAIIFSIAISSRATSCCATASQPFFLDYQGGRKGALQYDIASFCTTPRPTCLPNCASNCSITISTALPVSSISIAPSSCSHYYAYVYVRIMQAWARMASAAFTSAKSISAKRALRAEEPALAASQCGAAHRAAGT
jgi:hypothetical protein